MNERVAAEHEEQQHPLEDAGDLVGNAERNLCRLAAEICQRQNQSGGDDADRVQPPQESDDDCGEAVAGRDSLAQLANRAGDLGDPGKTGQRAGG